MFKRKCYKLQGFIDHQGVQASSGHYQAFNYSPEKSTWTKFNDNGGGQPTLITVSKKEIEENKKNAYILFYEESTKQEWTKVIGHRKAPVVNITKSNTIKYRLLGGMFPTATTSPQQKQTTSPQHKTNNGMEMDKASNLLQKLSLYDDCNDHWRTSDHEGSWQNQIQEEYADEIQKRKNAEEGEEPLDLVFSRKYNIKYLHHEYRQHHKDHNSIIIWI